MPALKELEQIVNGQTTVRTSKLKPLLQELAVEISNQKAEAGNESLIKEVNRKEKVIVRLQEEAKQYVLVRQRHKVAMQDYENLKKRHNRMQEEYSSILKAHSKSKDKVKATQRELTDLQVKYAALERKLKKAQGKK